MERRDEDKLKALFGEVKLEEPPAGLEKALLSRAKRESVVRSWLYMLLLPAAGVAIMAGAFYAAMLYFDPEWKIWETFPKLFADIFRPEYILLPATVVLLLVADTLIRKHLAKKTQ